MPARLRLKEPVFDTWGYVENAGSWDIEIYPDENFSVLETNERLLKYTDGFLLTFGDIVMPTGLVLDQSVLDENGREEEYREHACWLENYPGLDVIAEIKNYLLSDARILIPEIFVTCDLYLYARTNANKIERITIPKAAEYYFGVGETKANGRVAVKYIYLSFSTMIDIWLEKTYNSRLQRYFDNTKLANLNQPLLENALRNWEKLVGHPIDNVETCYYEDYISRYGYKNEEVEQKHDTEEKPSFA